MAESGKITKEDIYLKARLITEGVRISVKGKPIEYHPYRSYKLGKKATKSGKSWEGEGGQGEADFILRTMAGYMSTDLEKNPLSRTVTLDGGKLPAPVYSNKHSSLNMSIDDDKVIITERGEELGAGYFPKRKDWTKMKLSNGLPITAALPGMSAGIINVLFNYSCNNWNTNRACAYCGLFANTLSSKKNHLPIDTLQCLAKYQAEAVKIATDAGWRGSLAISGGAFTPSQRPNYLERLEVVMNELYKALDEKTFSRLHVVYNHYPPENFDDMEAWQDMGISGTSIDLEVMSPAYFAAICPGKHAYKPLEYWKDAQLASVDVFGPIIGTLGCVVVGIEPMSSLVKGMEERLSKGVMPIPLTFFSDPGSPYAGFRSPTADWLVDAADQIADSYLNHVPKFLPEMMRRRKARKSGQKEEKQSGASSMMPSAASSNSSHLTIVFDEVQRRVQGFMGGMARQSKKA